MSAKGSPTMLPPENRLLRESIMPILYFFSEDEFKDRAFINRDALNRKEEAQGDGEFKQHTDRSRRSASRRSGVQKVGCSCDDVAAVGWDSGSWAECSATDVAKE